MTVDNLALPRRYRYVVVSLFLGASVLSLLLAFRIPTGLAYLVSSYVAVALGIAGAALGFRWNAKVKRLQQG